MTEQVVLKVLDASISIAVLIALLGIVVYALWVVLKWGKTHVVKPVVLSHLKLMNTLNDNLPLQTTLAQETLAAVKENTIKIRTELKEQTDSIDRNNELLIQRTTLFEDIENNQSKIIEAIRQLKTNSDSLDRIEETGKTTHQMVNSQRDELMRQLSEALAEIRLLKAQLDKINEGKPS